jgi:hypothetical protein
VRRFMRYRDGDWYDATQAAVDAVRAGRHASTSPWSRCCRATATATRTDRADADPRERTGPRSRYTIAAGYATDTECAARSAGRTAASIARGIASSVEARYAQIRAVIDRYLRDPVARPGAGEAVVRALRHAQRHQPARDVRHLAAHDADTRCAAAGSACVFATATQQTIALDRRSQTIPKHHRRPPDRARHLGRRGCRAAISASRRSTPASTPKSPAHTARSARRRITCASRPETSGVSTCAQMAPVRRVAEVGCRG